MEDMFAPSVDRLPSRAADLHDVSQRGDRATLYARSRTGPAAERTCSCWCRRSFPADTAALDMSKTTAIATSQGSDLTHRHPGFSPRIGGGYFTSEAENLTDGTTWSSMRLRANRSSTRPKRRSPQPKPPSPARRSRGTARQSAPPRTAIFIPLLANVGRPDAAQALEYGAEGVIYSVLNSCSSATPGRRPSKSRPALTPSC